MDEVQSYETTQNQTFHLIPSNSAKSRPVLELFKITLETMQNLDLGLYFL